MAYDEYLAERVRQVFLQKAVPFEEKRMIGGLCFMVNDKMCVGINKNKQYGKNMLLARVGEHEYEKALQKPGCHVMDMTGRPMKGFVVVDEEAIGDGPGLEYWVQLCLNYNPLAKSSKK